MKTKYAAEPGFLLTPQSINAALKTGRRRHLCIECKGLELSLFLRKFDKPQFFYYWKDRDGERPKDCRVWVAEYDKNAEQPQRKLDAVKNLWKQAVAKREAKQPVVLEYPGDAKPETGEGKRKLRCGVTLAQAIPDYLKHLERCVALKDLSRTTATPWSTIIRRAGKAMPGVSLASLDTASLDTYFDDLVFNAQAKGADGRSSSVNARACFIHFFDWAVSKKLVSSNPAKETRQRKYKPSHAKVPDEDLSRYLVVLRKMRQAPKPERLAVTHYLWLMALTGYRKAELATATIGDFYLDERKRRINVEQAKDDEDHYIGLSHMAVRAVREQIRLLESQSLPTTKDALLFPAASALKKIQRWHGDGLKPMNDGVIYKHHQYITTMAGIEGFNIHDFRRILATMAAVVGIGPDYQRLLISHTTGRREAHGQYNLHRYQRELKEAASRLAVVFDFLSCEKQADGKRLPLECQDDYTESFAYWKSEEGRTFADEPPNSFYVVGLVQSSVVKLHERDLNSGFSVGVSLAEQEIRNAEKLPRNKVRRMGHALASLPMNAVTGDAAVLPFAQIQGDE